jgi:hypothetical protein
VRLPDKGGDRDRSKSRMVARFVHEFSSSPLRTGKRNSKTAWWSGSTTGNCEPPHTPEQEATIAKVTNRGGLGDFGNHLGNISPDWGP